MKKRILIGFLTVTLLLFAILMIDYIKLITNPKMMQLQELQIKTQESFQKYADTVYTAKQEIRISELTPFEWDYVALVSYYSDGERATKQLIASDLPQLELKDYSIFDERMGDSRQGIVFINMNEKFLLTVPLNAPFSGGDVSFANSIEACLESKFGPHTNKYFIFIKCSQGD